MLILKFLVLLPVIVAALVMLGGNVLCALEDWADR